MFIPPVLLQEDDDETEKVTEEEEKRGGKEQRGEGRSSEGSQEGEGGRSALVHVRTRSDSAEMLVFLFWISIREESEVL